MRTLLIAALCVVACAVEARQQAPTTTIRFEGGGLSMKDITERLRTNGIVLRLAVPTPSNTICQVKETLHDMLAERGFPEPQVEHDLREDMRHPGEMVLTFRIVPGEKWGGRIEKPVLTVAQRCAR